MNLLAYLDLWDLLYKKEKRKKKSNTLVTFLLTVQDRFKDTGKEKKIRFWALALVCLF